MFSEFKVFYEFEIMARFPTLVSLSSPFAKKEFSMIIIIIIK